jgi:hypothetical protein
MMARLLPRISLATAFLLTTIVGLSIVTFRLWREVAPLREQVRSMRSELGLLNIEDPTVAQAIQLGSREADHWKWRIYLPPGSEYELFVYSGRRIPPHKGLNWFAAVKKDGSGMSTTMDGGEFVFEVRLVKKGMKWMVSTSRGLGGDDGEMSIDGDWLSQKMGRSVSSSAGFDKATTFRPGEAIHLMSIFEPVVTQNGTSTSWTSPTGPANGIVIWIEQRIPATNSPAAAAAP